MEQSTKTRTKFVRFGIDEFKAALSYIVGPQREVNIPGVWEYTFDIGVKKVPGLVIRIYSSIDKITGMSRDKGSDAIRLVVLRDDNKMALSDYEKVLRTLGWSERMHDKTRDLIGYAIKLICPKCKILLATKTGKHGPFLGCVNYPTCTHTQSIVERSKRDTRRAPVAKT